MERPAAQVEAMARWRRWLAKGRGRWLGLFLAIAFTGALLLPDPGPLPPLRFATFDSYQLLFPREPRSHDVTLVEIDDASLSVVGQWPWPRTILAALIERVASRGPKVIALDMLLTEPDRTSPDRVAAMLELRDEKRLAADLRQLKGNDEILGEIIANSRVVVGAVGGFENAAAGPALAPSRTRPPPPPLHDYRGTLRSLPAIDAGAAGRGLVNVEPERGIIRRVPLVALAEGAPALSLAGEAIRVADRAPFFTVGLDEHGLTRVDLGKREVAVQPDGKLWLWFAPRTDGRTVSAADVFRGNDNPASLKDKIVLIGLSAAGSDNVTTARGELVPGVEVHAQVVENILEGSTLRRPEWSRIVEALSFALIAGVIVLRAPRTTPRRSFLYLFAGWLAFIALGVGAFYGGRVLFDIVTPLAGATVIYGFVLSGALVAADVDKRRLEKTVQEQRVDAARVAGELAGAQRIQTGILPTRESALQGERRVDIFTHMQPAREVGGDLYDFFLLPDQRLFVLQGDVSGKGLPAAMFMAVTKAVVKSCALRAPANAAEMMQAFNKEVSRENPEEMFVTLAILLIDLGTGHIEYCNAGHEPPLLVRRSGETLVLDDAGGPPLCVVDDFPYEQATAQLEPRDIIVLASDGITEAMTRDGAVYGRDRLKAVLQAPERRNLDITVLGAEILASVRTFEAGAEPADDQTLLVVLWRGRA